MRTQWREQRSTTTFRRGGGERAIDDGSPNRWPPSDRHRSGLDLVGDLKGSPCAMVHTRKRFVSFVSPPFFFCMGKRVFGHRSLWPGLAWPGRCRCCLVAANIAWRAGGRADVQPESFILPVHRTKCFLPPPLALFLTLFHLLPRLRLSHAAPQPLTFRPLIEVHTRKPTPLPPWPYVAPPKCQEPAPWKT